MSWKFFLFIGLCFMLSCSTKGYFSIMESSSQRWSGGVKGSGSGITVTFQIKVKSDEIDSFTKAWIGDRVSEINLKRLTLEEIGEPVGKNDIIILECRMIDGDEEFLTPPIDHDGEALIEFIVDGDKKYATVKEIKQMEKQINY